jgi:hypothetical protein
MLHNILNRLFYLQITDQMVLYRFKTLRFLATELVLILFLLGCKDDNKHTTELMAGVSCVSITPGKGAFIAGDKRNRRFTGVHDSLFVKALVVTDSKKQVTLLSFDCIGLLYPTLLEIRKEAAAKMSADGFDPDCIVMSSTHTHAGPDVVGIWGPDELTSGVDTVYMKKLVQAATSAIANAWKNKKSVKVQYAGTIFGEGLVYNISDSLNLDRAVSIIQFTGDQGQSVATLTNFACHPTFMDAATDQVSADYLYGLYQHLDSALGGVNFFLQGAIGGWVQPEYEPKTFESAYRRGKELGKTVETALKTPVQMYDPLITYKSKKLNLPVTNEGFQQLSAAGVINRCMTDSVLTEIAWFSIGAAQFVTHPGESSPGMSLQSKQLMKTTGPKFVIGLGNDALGYILTPDYFNPDSRMKHTGYLTSMSVDREAGNIMMKAITQLASEK